MKKLHFYDTGLCSRLQGHQAPETLMNSPQVGALFESLVFSEIAKTNSNHLRRWVLHTWRTKEQSEIDFIIENGEQITMVEAKLGIQSARPLELDTEAKKAFPKVFKKVVVTAGGDETMLDATTARVPIFSLGAWLLKNL